MTTALQGVLELEATLWTSVRRDHKPLVFRCCYKVCVRRSCATLRWSNSDCRCCCAWCSSWCMHSASSLRSPPMLLHFGFLVLALVGGFCVSLSPLQISESRAYSIKGYKRQVKHPQGIARKGKQVLQITQSLWTHGSAFVLTCPRWARKGPRFSWRSSSFSFLLPQRRLKAAAPQHNSPSADAQHSLAHFAAADFKPRITGNELRAPR